MSEIIPKLPDWKLLECSDLAIKQAAHALSHVEYTQFKIERLKHIIMLSTKRRKVFGSRKLALLMYRRKALDWLQKQLTELQ